MIPNSVRRQDTLWSFVVFLITSDKRRHTVLSNDQFFLTLSNKLTRRDCVWWTQLRSTQILPSRYFISKCHVSQRMRKFLYTERPCWCNIHDVYPSYQSHTKHSWSFIVWQLVSTSSTGHQWALGVIDATDIHNNVISLTSIKKRAILGRLERSLKTINSMCADIPHRIIQMWNILVSRA